MIQHDEHRHTPLVLIADDDELTRSLIAAALSDKGFETVEVGNGRDAVTAFPRLRPDLVVLDVDMPVLNGYEACLLLREMDGPGNVPIVIVTGNEDSGSIERAYQVGATDFISKPVNWTLLGHRMRYVLRGAETRAALAEREAENRALLEALPDRLALISATGEVLKAIGHHDADAPDSLAALVSESALDVANASLRRALAESSEQSFEFSAADGSQASYFEARVVPEFERTALLIIRDVTERKRAEARIHELAYFDTLTALPNRHHFLQQAGEAIDQADPDRDAFALFCMDLDQFKRINDTLGHPAGDSVLVQVAERLKNLRDSLFRSGVTYIEIARLGGDEFVLLAVASDDAEVGHVAAAMATQVTQPVDCDRHKLVITPSIGIASYPRHGRDIETLLRHADSAMSAAKSTGGNSQCIYSESSLESSRDDLTLESELRDALGNDGLSLHFQPKYELATSRMIGAEALLRWVHAERGFVSPAEFIPAAERSGLIIDIDRWVADRVCQYLHEWQTAGLACVPVSINMSGREFCFDQPTVTLERAMGRHAVEPALLEVEITETVLMADADAATETLRGLKGMGIRLAVDDFGTGYSSLGYLKRFPLDVLKIDRSFIGDLEEDENDRTLCEAMISMAHSLGLEVVAEGIETEFQRDFLENAGCQTGQGYLLDRPMPAEDFRERLLTQVGSVADGRTTSETRPRQRPH